MTRRSHRRKQLDVNFISTPCQFDGRLRKVVEILLHAGRRAQPTLDNDKSKQEAKTRAKKPGRVRGEARPYKGKKVM